MGFPYEDLKVEIITLKSREHLGSLHLNDGKHGIRVTHLPIDPMVECHDTRGGGHKMRERCISMIEWGLLQ